MRWRARLGVRVNGSIPGLLSRVAPKSEYPSHPPAILTSGTRDRLHAPCPGQ